MIATRFSGRADRYTEQDESRTRAMPNDRVQLRPPRRLLAASGDVCSKTQKPLLEKEFDTGACVIDVPSVVKGLSGLLTEGEDGEIHIASCGLVRNEKAYL